MPTRAGIHPGTHYACLGTVPDDPGAGTILSSIAAALWRPRDRSLNTEHAHLGLQRGLMQKQNRRTQGEGRPDGCC
jgi:hypothetical protein